MRNIFCCYLSLLFLQVLAGSPVEAKTDDNQSAENLLKINNYRGAETLYRKLLQSDQSPENYAGLAQSLALQDKIKEAELVIMDARTNGFGKNPNLSAVSGLVAYLHAYRTSAVYYPLYLEASVVFCKRALSSEPNNKLAADTLVKAEIRSMKLEKAKAFEKTGDLDRAEKEYMDLLEQYSDDIDAASGILKIWDKKIDRHEEIPDFFISKVRPKDTSGKNDDTTAERGFRLAPKLQH